MRPITVGLTLGQIAWHDCKAAVRGLHARGWRAVFVVGILAAALAANTLLFAVADSLILRPLPYLDVDRLITLKAAFADGRPPQTLSLRPPRIVDDLRERRDLFSTFHAYTRGSYTFVMDDASAASEPTAFVTPGLFEVLGWAPILGRSLAAGDVTRINPRVAVVAQSLAAERFGDSRFAIGRTLETSEDPLLIVGVMPKGFQFPDGTVRVWRPLDYPRATGALYAIARLAPGVTAAQATAGLTGLGGQLTAERTIQSGGTLVAAPLDGTESGAPALVLLVMGAGGCLLIIACANTAGVEIAGAIARAGSFAIQVSLGATRASLVRRSAIEGALIVGCSILMAAPIVRLGEATVAASLPESLLLSAANPVNLDARSLAFLTVLGCLTWVVATLPVAIHASRSNILPLLQTAGHPSSAAHVRSRRALTVVQVALAVLLLVVSVLYTRTYASLLGVDKGFESARIATIDLTLPTATYSEREAIHVLSGRIEAALSQRSDVESFAQLPNVLDAGTTMNADIEVDDGRGETRTSRIAVRTADAAFFDTMRLPLLRGRFFEQGEPETSILITPELADRLWAGRDAVGRRLRAGAGQPWLTVIGIVGPVRFRGELPGVGRRNEVFEVYVPPPAPSPPRGTATLPPGRPQSEISVTPGPNVPQTGPVFMFLSYVARLRPGALLDDVETDLRRIDVTYGLRVRWIDQAYAQAYQDRLLAVRAVSGFAGLSFALSVAGVYAIMTLLVASRRREFAIRAALGADSRRICVQVLHSAARLVGLGAVLGIASAIATTTALRAQLYGVEPTDPTTYAGVTAVVAVAALLAGWGPAVRAARTDPAETLRAE